jgi:hypothetical protein
MYVAATTIVLVINFVQTIRAVRLADASIVIQRTTVPVMRNATATKVNVSVALNAAVMANATAMNTALRATYARKSVNAAPTATVLEPILASITVTVFQSVRPTTAVTIQNVLMTFTVDHLVIASALMTAVATAIVVMARSAQRATHAI